MGKKKKKKNRTNLDDQSFDSEDKTPTQPKVRLGTFADIWPKDLRR